MNGMFVQVSSFSLLLLLLQPHALLGRTIDIIRNTLPDFFTLGLITQADKATGEAKIPPPIVGSTPLSDIAVLQDSSVDHLYSPTIRLSYTPPSRLPSPFPETLQVEGSKLYLASAMFVRHTLTALYSDISVVINKVEVKTEGKASRPADDALPVPRNKVSTFREKTLFIRLTVYGRSRLGVSAPPAEWQVYVLILALQVLPAYGPSGTVHTRSRHAPA